MVLFLGSSSNAAGKKQALFKDLLIPPYSSSKKVKDLSSSSMASAIIRIQGKTKPVGRPSASLDSSSTKDGQDSGQNTNGQKLTKPIRVYGNKKSANISNPSLLHPPIQVDLESELENADNPIIADQDYVIYIFKLHFMHA